MKKFLQNLLICPNDFGDLELRDPIYNGEDVESGILRCISCSRTFSIIKGIPRFVDSDSYVDNFSLEWNIHTNTQLDSANQTTQSRDTFIRRTGFIKEDLEGKTVLDVGCGSGRFLEIARTMGALTIGVDMSYAVDAALKNLSHDSNVHLVQADIFHLPFRKEVFDSAYSIGVLHHTPNTKSAFEHVIPLVKNNGKIAIWVYNNWGIYNTFSDIYRVVTTRLPKKMLYKLCRVFVPAIYFFHKRNKLWRYIIPIPIDYNQDPEWRILNTFDWYSPKYQWKHNEAEVLGWFQEHNFRDIKVNAVPVSISGRK